MWEFFGKESFPQVGGGKTVSIVEKLVDYAENLNFRWFIRAFSTNYAENENKCMENELWKTFSAGCFFENEIAGRWKNTNLFENY